MHHAGAHAGIELGCASLSGIRAETKASMSAAVRGLSSGARMRRMWACGRPRFRNSTVYTPPWTLPRTWFFVRFRQELSELHVEDAAGEIWPVVGRLTMQQLPGDLWPGGVAGEGDKQGGLPIVANNGHGVLVQLLHLPGPATEAGREHKAGAHSGRVCISSVQGILHAINTAVRRNRSEVLMHADQ